MSAILSHKDAAILLRQAKDVLILSHQNPDGDTLGSAYALCRALRAIGKRARVYCPDAIPQKYSYLRMGLPDEQFIPGFVAAVDVADVRLLGDDPAVYGGRVDLCIDHHLSNTRYAGHLLLEDCAATAEIVYEIIGQLGVEMDIAMGRAIYTGISTDTGCFRYANTTARTHRIAARLIELGVSTHFINRQMFEIKSRARFAIESLVLNSIEYYHDNRCAVMYITQDMITQVGSMDGDLEGLAAIPRQIEGVKVGITMTEKGPDLWRVSVRTGDEYDASLICGRLGGGGHARAAGCSVTGSAREACDQIVAVVAAVMCEKS